MLPWLLCVYWLCQAESLIDVIRLQGPLLEKEQLRVVGVVGVGDHSTFDARGIGLDVAADILGSSRKALATGRASTGGGGTGDGGAGAAACHSTDESVLEMVHKVKHLPNPIIVDCSGSAEHEDLYNLCRSLAVNVVVGNVRSIDALSAKFFGLGAAAKKTDRGFTAAALGRSGRAWTSLYVAGMAFPASGADPASVVLTVVLTSPPCPCLCSFGANLATTPRVGAR